MNLLGGYVEASRFFLNEGLEVLQTLCDPKAHQCGLELPQISGFANRFKRSKNDTAKKTQDETTKRQLERLLEAGLARRGFALTCPHCDLKDWYAVEAMRENIICPGCAQEFSLPFENPKYFYKANQLAVRCLLDSGGTAVLMAAATFRSLEDSGCIQFGAEISRPNAPDLEVDLIWTVGKLTILTECKSLQFIKDDQISDIKESLDKTLEAATILSAQIVILAVSTPVEDISSLLQIVEDKQADAVGRNVALHLIVNAKVFVKGRRPKDETYSVSLFDLLPPQEQKRITAEIDGVGSWPKGIAPMAAPIINADVVTSWLNNFKQN